MQYVRYRQGANISYGMLEGEYVYRLNDAPWKEAVRTGEVAIRNEVELLSPVLPGKLIAIGLNYRKHAEEMKRQIPSEPLMFLVSPTAVAGPQETIALAYSEHHTEHEGELAIVIGRPAYQIAPEQAMDYVLGYTLCNDVSDRTLQQRDGQFTRAKSFATYKPLGPVIATDLDPDHLSLQVRVNGEIRQYSSTADMIFSTRELLSFVSQVIRLDPGDVILTGTPSGVGPLLAGDRIEVEIPEIGVLYNPVSLREGAGT